MATNPYRVNIPGGLKEERYVAQGGEIKGTYLTGMKVGGDHPKPGQRLGPPISGRMPETGHNIPNPKKQQWRDYWESVESWWEEENRQVKRNHNWEYR